VAKLLEESRANNSPISKLMNSLQPIPLIRRRRKYGHCEVKKTAKGTRYHAKINVNNVSYSKTFDDRDAAEHWATEVAEGRLFPPAPTKYNKKSTQPQDEEESSEDEEESSEDDEESSEDEEESSEDEEESSEEEEESSEDAIESSEDEEESSEEEEESSEEKRKHLGSLQANLLIRRRRKYGHCEVKKNAKGTRYRATIIKNWVTYCKTFDDRDAAEHWLTEIAEGRLVPPRPSNHLKRKRPKRRIRKYGNCEVKKNSKGTRYRARITVNKVGYSKLFDDRDVAEHWLTEVAEGRLVPRAPTKHNKKSKYGHCAVRMNGKGPRYRALITRNNVGYTKTFDDRNAAEHWLTEIAEGRLVPPRQSKPLKRRRPPTDKRRRVVVRCPTPMYFKPSEEEEESSEEKRSVRLMSQMGKYLFPPAGPKRRKYGHCEEKKTVKGTRYRTKITVNNVGYSKTFDDRDAAEHWLTEVAIGRLVPPAPTKYSKKSTQEEESSEEEEETSEDKEESSEDEEESSEDKEESSEDKEESSEDEEESSEDEEESSEDEEESSEEEEESSEEKRKHLGSLQSNPLITEVAEGRLVPRAPTKHNKKSKYGHCVVTVNGKGPRYRALITRNKVTYCKTFDDRDAAEHWLTEIAEGRLVPPRQSNHLKRKRPKRRRRKYGHCLVRKTSKGTRYHAKITVKSVGYSKTFDDRDAAEHWLTKVAKGRFIPPKKKKKKPTGSE
jgi:hypothetical protein